MLRNCKIVYLVKNTKLRARSFILLPVLLKKVAWCSRTSKNSIWKNCNISSSRCLSKEEKQDELQGTHTHILEILSLINIKENVKS